MKSWESHGRLESVKLDHNLRCLHGCMLMGDGLSCVQITLLIKKHATVICAKSVISLEHIEDLRRSQCNGSKTPWDLAVA